MIRGATRQHLRPDRTTHRCESQKMCYTTREEALDAAERMMDEGRVDPGCHITPYACDRCAYWHVANRRIVFK